MLEVRRDYRCCDRFAGTATTARTSRRRMLKAAVFGAQDDLVDGASALTARRRPAAGLPAAGQLPRALTGVVHDVSPHVLVIGTGGTEQRIALTAGATAWRGGPVDPAGLQPGDQTVVRLHRSRRGVADRIWANIGRVTGTIIEHSSDFMIVDEGVTRQRQIVVIPPRSAGRIQVRFPTLQPGYLPQLGAYLILAAAMFLALMLQAFGSRIFPLIAGGFALAFEIVFRDFGVLAQIVACAELLIVVGGYAAIVLARTVRHAY